MTTNANAWTLSSVNQHGCIPTHPSAIGALDLFITREFGLVFRRDGVQVVGGRNVRDIQLKLVRTTKQVHHDFAGAAAAVDHAPREHGVGEGVAHAAAARPGGEEARDGLVRDAAEVGQRPPVGLELREERRARFMAVAESVSAAKLQRRVGATMQVLVDSAPALGRKGGVGRSYADAPEIDGVVKLLPPEKASKTLKVGEFTRARIVGTQGHDLIALPI